MDLTVALTGMLPFIVLVSAALTAVASVALLWLYRRAVTRAMATGLGTPEQPTATPAQARSEVRAELKVATVTIGDPAFARTHTAFAETSASLRRLALVYILAGLTYAVVLALPWMITARGGFPLTRLLWLIACYAWPIVLTLLLVAATTRRGQVWLTAVYFLVVGSIAALALMGNPNLGLGQLVYFWLFANGPATLLLVAFLARRIRAVGPLVLVFMVAGVTGASLTVTVVGSADELLRALAHAGNALGIGAIGVFVLLHAIGFAVFGAVGWGLLGRLGVAYRAKRLSDQSLTADALWLVFGVLQSITLAFEGWTWIFTGLVAFAAYKVVRAVGFAKLLRTSSEQYRSPCLLLLRVFALGRRSESLFEVFSKRWLRAGSIDLIAGPDLVTRTVEPHEFLSFVGGRLSRRFINDENDLEQHLAGRDTLPDPDGRYRVNEFFCRRDTWQPTMKRLAADSDSVLMDLRSFSPVNQGCLWELEQLLFGVALERVVFVIDETTDQPFLESKLQALWRAMPPESANPPSAEPVAKLFLSPSVWQSGDSLAKVLLPARELARSRS